MHSTTTKLLRGSRGEQKMVHSKEEQKLLELTLVNQPKHKPSEPQKSLENPLGFFPRRVVVTSLDHLAPSLKHLPHFTFSFLKLTQLNRLTFVSSPATLPPEGLPLFCTSFVTTHLILSTKLVVIISQTFQRLGAHQKCCFALHSAYHCLRTLRTLLRQALA